ncbi:MAG: primosomal protein N' [Dysgonamonadaceae bacterium]|jgi:primosomal protein N' (replication factor Y)|nr:primosomal protein N' [Dysgonamonadaceae bacterium]
MYIEVILPVPLADTFTYFVPPEMEAQIVSGSLVWVSFGKNKRYTGMVSHIRQIPPVSTQRIKTILSVEQSQPVIRRPQIQFWEWLSKYYLCSLGEVFKAVLPSGFRMEKTHSYSEKKETYIRFSSPYNSSEKLQEAFQQIKRAPKQEQMLLAFIQHTKQPDFAQKEIGKKELLTKSISSNEVALSGLVKKNILESFEKSVSRLEEEIVEIKDLNILHPIQNRSYTEIVQAFRKKDVCLLHGVTSSGKTEIYTHLIRETLKLNKQILYLLPEIALTKQITNRLKRFFGNKLGVYHSGINNNERVEIWNNLLEGNGYQIILGVRSSIFLPFRDLGLVIVDEEHEPTYKQQDPSPRYHARNAAIVLATMHGAKVVLGSATPSIESFYNAQTGKYAYVKLDKRFEETALPTIVPVDVKELRRKKKMKSIFSPLLIEKMQDTLDKGEQILLFQNRRGFAPVIRCKVCDWTPRCRSCDISLSYHKKHDRLTCHYCGNTYRIPTECPECGSNDLQAKGYGTEKVEEEIKKLFPSVSVERMDTDTTRKKNSIENIISRLENGKTRILIGTQMISKGLDFDKVSLVGILNADILMNYPDFRAYERAFQLMSQVAGRAGRRKQQGEVILQTSHPDHPLIQTVLRNDYEEMYRLQVEERNLFRYPPFFRLIQISFKHKKEHLAQKAAEEMTFALQKQLGKRVIGPDKPIIGKIQNLYIRKILLKIEVASSIHILREILEQTQKELIGDQAFRYVIIQYDVDPVS